VGCLVSKGHVSLYVVGIVNQLFIEAFAQSECHLFPAVKGENISFFTQTRRGHHRAFICFGIHCLYVGAYFLEILVKGHEAKVRM
ncbi:MAG: hypothetical protein ACI84C_002828, partial [Flavobacteriales bacterium]